jgi:effector-binding domain-containing protein
MPTDTVEVAAGFPVSGPIEASGEVVPMELPAGRAVTCIHVGPFERLQDTYGELLERAAAEGVDLAEGMWESYLTDPAAEPDQSKWLTGITWPVR